MPDYEDSNLIESWSPLVRGNPETGEVKIGNAEFSEEYTGPDYRIKANRMTAIEALTLPELH